MLKAYTKVTKNFSNISQNFLNFSLSFALIFKNCFQILKDFSKFFELFQTIL